MENEDGYYSHEDLRALYLEDLKKEVCYDGKKIRPRVRNWRDYEKIPTWETINEGYWGEGVARGIWVWSDTHFGHKNIIKYCDRPYECTDDMAHAMIENHNRVVADDDVVMWVGDVAFMGPEKTNEILRQLKGKRELVIGNHDINKHKVKKMDFDAYGLLSTLVGNDGQNLVFTHFPMENCPPNWINVHGHIHNSYEMDSLNHINVSVEVIDYTPMSIGKLLSIASTRLTSMETT